MSSSASEKKKFFHGSLSKEDGPWRNYINILIGYIDTMVLYNLFFIVVSLGVITIGPALVALTDCFNDFIGNKTEERYRKFFIKFKENFSLANVLLGLALVVILVGSFYLILFCAENYGKAMYLVAPWIMANFLMFFSCCFFAYYALMKVRMVLPTQTILKNALFLTFGDIKTALLCLLSFAVLFMAPLVFLEYCFPLFLILEFSWTVLSFLMSIYKTVDRYVIYDKEKEAEEKEKENEVHLRLDLLPDKKETKKK